MRRWCSASALIAAAACALPAAAQQSVGGAPERFVLPLHPTEAGKPLIYDPRFGAKFGNDKAGDDKDCTPGFSCRLRLFGVIQNNGAVELRATAFTW